ncbi:MAG: 60S ribosomal protein L7A [Marteilia pararefringens]
MAGASSNKKGAIQSKKGAATSAAAGKKKVASVKKSADAKKQQKKQQQQPEEKKTRSMKNPLFVARKKNFSIGHDMLPNRDLTHCVKFPRYVRTQRRLKTLKKRLQEPPQIYQFQNVVDVSFRHNLAELMANIAPESASQKKIRIRSMIEKETIKDAVKMKKFEAPKSQVSFGLEEVTRHILQQKSQLVVIAANVEPMHLILPLPSLCVKHKIPYCIVSDKGWLGKLVNQKKVVCLSINKIDSKAPAKSQSILTSLIKIADSSYNQKYADTITKKGESILSLRAKSAHDKKEKIRKAEIEKSKRIVIE